MMRATFIHAVRYALGAIAVAIACSSAHADGLGPRGCQNATLTTIGCVRSNGILNVGQFGAKSDAVTTTADGSLTISSALFCSSVVTFTSADVGKIFEAMPANNGTPWRTTIASTASTSGCPGGSISAVNLSYVSPITYPGTIKATQANINLQLNGGDNTPGTGWVPADCATVQGGTYTTQAIVCVKGTGLVSFTQTSVSCSPTYVVGNILAITDSLGTDKQKFPAQIQVNTIDGNGCPATWTFLSYGEWKAANPIAGNLSFVGGSGTGATLSLASNDGSFGFVDATFTGGNKGSYSVAPTDPVTLVANSGHGAGATADIAFPQPNWIYGTDDTAAIVACEAAIEGGNDSRGLGGTCSLPCNTQTLFTTFETHYAVGWQGCGLKGSRLLRIAGAAGTSLNSSPVAAILLTIGFKGDDDYQQSNNGIPMTTFQNMSIWGATPLTSVYIDGGGAPSSDTVACVEATDPASNKARATLFNLANMEIVNCPGYSLGGYNLDGGFITTNLTLDNSGTDCFNANFMSQPSKMEQLRIRNCVGVAQNIYKSSDITEDQVEEFNALEGFLFTGYSTPGKMFFCSACHITDNVQQGVEQDAVDLIAEFVGPRFFGNNSGGATSGDFDSNFTLGATAGGFNGHTGAVAIKIIGGSSDSITTDNEFYFDVGTNGLPCSGACYVSTDGYYVNKNGTTTIPPPSNYPALVHGMDALASPFLAVGATIGAGASQLPACTTANNGARYQVNDAAASPVFNATASGGGSVVVGVVCDGSNWVYGG